MARYIFLRILGLIGTLLVLSLVVFLLMHAIPGGPFDLSGGDKGITLPDAVRQEILKSAGLDKPLPLQYANYVWRAFHFDFGYSFYKPSETVNEIISRTWKVSAQLGIITFFFAAVTGITLGIISGFNQNTIIDYFTTTLAVIGTVFPNFVVAVILVVIFSVFLRWLPSGGWGEPKNWIMPVIAYSLLPMSQIARYTRTSVIEVLNQDYIRTAIAKGSSKGVLIKDHILRNAMIPILTILGPIFADVLTGSFFIETIFRIPGLGRYFTSSITARDYPMILGTTLLVAAMMSLVNLLTDILYAIFDPRIRFS